MSQRFSVQLPATVAFDYPTPAALADCIASRLPVQRKDQLSEAIPQVAPSRFLSKYLNELLLLHHVQQVSNDFAPFFCLLLFVEHKHVLHIPSCSDPRLDSNACTCEMCARNWHGKQRARCATKSGLFPYGLCL